MADGPEASTKPVVLVIDDEKSIRLALRRYFERRGWVMLEAEDGAVAEALLLGADRRHIDVVICDLKMPGITGMELYRRVQRERPELVKRLVFSSGDINSPESARFLESTGCRVIEKPFELPVLAQTVDAIRHDADLADA